VEIAAARRVLALKVGGDTAFGRSTQVIRIPGSIYGKGGVTRLCAIAERNGYEYDLDELLTAIADMPVMEGLEVDAGKLMPLLAPVHYSQPGGGLSFSGYHAVSAGVAKPSIGTSLTTDVYEGGDEDTNRWKEFNRVAGLHIHQARAGNLTVDEARTHTETWVALHMKPAWPPIKFDNEWKGLLAHDARGRDPIAGTEVVRAPAGLKQIIDVEMNGNGTFEKRKPVSDWAVSLWTQGDKPKRKFLVEGMVLAGKSHMLAAEGGAGKTMMLLDLALKIATHSKEKLQSWCDLPLAEDAGGTVVMLTTEDDMDELHIRLADLDPENTRKTIGKRLIIIPTINDGGAFQLVVRDKATGAPKMSDQWIAFCNQIKDIDDLRLVVIDTLNTTLHGEENSATIVNEYIQAASADICGQMGAALMVTHHVRKPSQNTKINTPEDMKNSIRGSTALIGAFRVVLGLWHAPDYAERLERIGREAKPGQIYNFAVVKANNPEMAYGTRAMLRQASGVLVDITDAEKKLIGETMDLHDAWMLKAVEYAAAQFRPFSIKSAKAKPPNGRKHQLPACLQHLSEAKITYLCERLISGGWLHQCNPKGQTSYNYLDITDGPLATAMGTDGFDYKIATGADFKAPNWELLFRFDEVLKRVVPAPPVVPVPNPNLPRK
jgi:RecA-family ATPase